MLCKVASETFYEKRGRGVGNEGECVKRERERERVAFVVCALSSINDLRFTHFLSNWASLFFVK